MHRAIYMGALLMWVLTAEGAVAWPGGLGTCVAGQPRAGTTAQRAPVSPYVDPATGTTMTLSRRGNGPVLLTAVTAGLQVTKQVTPAGTFDLRLETATDTVRVVVNGNRMHVGRGNKKAVLDADALDDMALPRIQVVLAGSPAVRQFRQVFASLDDTTRRRPEGAALAVIDAVLGWLQGDVDAVRRARPRAASPKGPIVRAAATQDEKDSCYEVWEGEVLEAWNDYESCVYSFEWWNPAREVCAFLWVIRVESAWFTMIGCSAIPIKIEAP